MAREVGREGAESVVQKDSKAIFHTSESTRRGRELCSLPGYLFALLFVSGLSTLAEPRTPCPNLSKDGAGNTLITHTTGSKQTRLQKRDCARTNSSVLDIGILFDLLLEGFLRCQSIHGRFLLLMTQLIVLDLKDIINTSLVSWDFEQNQEEMG